MNAVQAQCAVVKETKARSRALDTFWSLSRETDKGYELDYREVSGLPCDGPTVGEEVWVTLWSAIGFSKLRIQDIYCCELERRDAH